MEDQGEGAARVMGQDPVCLHLLPEVWGELLGWVTWAPSCLCPPGDQTPDCLGECGDSTGKRWQACGDPQVE